MSKRNAKKYPVASVEYCDGAAKFAQAADGTITVTLTGRIAANLHKIAAAMNAVPWCGDDNTGASVTGDFVFWQQVENLNDEPPYHDWDGLGDETSVIVDMVNTGADEGGELDAKRKAELSQAFAKAFRFVTLKETLAGCQGK